MRLPLRLLSCALAYLFVPLAGAQWSATIFPSDVPNGLSRDGTTFFEQPQFGQPTNAIRYWNIHSGFNSVLPAPSFYPTAIYTDGQIFYGDAAQTSANAYYSVPSKYTLGHGSFDYPSVPGIPPSQNYYSAGAWIAGSSIDATRLLMNSSIIAWAFLPIPGQGARPYVFYNGVYTEIPGFGAPVPQTWGTAISSDGSTVVGYSYDPRNIQLPLRWTPNGGTQYLGMPPGAMSGAATCVSGDGSIVYGRWYDSANNPHGFKWTAAAGVRDVPGLAIDRCSADGKVAIGVMTANNISFGAIGFGRPDEVQDMKVILLNKGQGQVAPWSLINFNNLTCFMSDDGFTMIFPATTPGFYGSIYVHTNGTPADAGDDAYTAQPDQVLTVSGLGVFANDNPKGGLAEVVTPPQHGQLVLDGGGSFSYRPDHGFSGVDTFTYWIDRDGGQMSNIATVTINVPTPTLEVDVEQRLGLGPVPDGTVVQVLNNDGTALSTPQSAPTLSGIAGFTAIPGPTAPNVDYAVKVLVPAGGRGAPLVYHHVTLGSSLNLYFTSVRGFVSQSLTSAPPVGFAQCAVAGYSGLTSTAGMTPTVWLPDGSYGARFAMSPGLAVVNGFTLGSSCTGLVSGPGYGIVSGHLTRIYLTARTLAGFTFIPSAGTWSISPGSLSAPVSGQAISQSWWLPDGSYTGALSGAAKNGSSSFTVGPPTAGGMRTVVVN